MLTVRVHTTYGHTEEFVKVTGVSESADGVWLILSGGNLGVIAQFIRNYVTFFTVHEDN